MFILVYIFHLATAESNSWNTSLSCSSWSQYDEKENACMCSDELTYVFHCNKTGYIDGTATCSCVTYKEEEDQIESGHCAYECHWPSDRYALVGYSIFSANKSKWNYLQCGPFKRTGTLCGACQSGTYMRAYSFNMECIACDSNRDWWKFILWAFLPMTVFYFLVLLYPVNLSSSPLFGLVFYSQVVSAPTRARFLFINFSNVPTLLTITKLLLTFHGIWNFDFFRPYSNFCLQIDSLTVLLLELVVAIYPLILIAITHLVMNTNIKLAVMVKKKVSSWLFTRITATNRANFTMKCYATFIILSYVKILDACLDLLTPVNVYQLVTPTNITTSLRLYYDATVPYFGSKHLPYATVAVTMLVIFDVIPVLTLILFSFNLFQKCLNNFLPPRWQLILRTFLDYFQGCFKNGTEPNCKDCRWFSSVPFIFHFLSCLVFWTTSDSLLLPWNSILIVILVILVIVFEPYKDFKLSYNLITYNMVIIFLSVGGCIVAMRQRHGFLPYMLFYILVAAGSLPMLHTLYLILQFAYAHRLTFLRLLGLTVN